MKNPLKTQILLLATTLFISPFSLADWVLDSKASSLYFLSTKNTSKTEVHTFKKLSGHLSEAGHASINIDLGSVETNIPIRNERIQELLFEVAQFPQATITLDVDMKQLLALTPGDAVKQRVEATLNLHGASKPIVANVLVAGLKAGGLMAATQAPVIVSLKDFNLLGGIDQLRSLAKLDSIDAKVPVTFTLVFDQQ